MAQKLAGNVPGRPDFEGDVDHFERGPMPVPHEVGDEPGPSLHIVLICGVRDARTVGDEVDGPTNAWDEGLGDGDGPDCHVSRNVLPSSIILRTFRLK